MRALRPALLLASACYSPPSDLEVIPYDAPVLSSEGTNAISACAPPREVQVRDVIDGDTFDLRGTGDDEERVRVLGIDAPEVANREHAAECGADAAERELDRLIDNATVTLSFDQDCAGVFDRTLAYVWLDRDRAESRMGTDAVDEVLSLVGDPDDPDALVMVNLYLLLEGWVVRYDEDFVEPLRYENELIAAENLALARQAGVWGTCE